MFKNDILLMGKNLIQATRVRKNQKIEKETNLYFENSRLAKNKIVAKNKKLIKRVISKILLKTG